MVRIPVAPGGLGGAHRREHQQQVRRRSRRRKSLSDIGDCQRPASGIRGDSARSPDGRAGDGGPSREYRIDSTAIDQHVIGTRCRRKDFNCIATRSTVVETPTA